MQEKINSSISLEKITIESSYSRVLCYPNPSENELKKRIEELKNLGIEALIFEGKTKIDELHILGKGCVSLTVKVSFGNKDCVLKIRRVDANRENLLSEAKYLRMANSVQVGPKLFLSSKNFLIMEYINGVSIVEWCKANNSKYRLKKICKELLNQTFRLDKMGLDHGELSNLAKHVLIAQDNPYIIDFESASNERRVKNVTSLAQYIFVGSSISKKVRRTLNIDEEKMSELFKALKAYKQKVSEENFFELMRALKMY
ncbi:MAG: RIO1 family regulatory kinase/ATPase [Nitrososphaerales archaeon]